MTTPAHSYFTKTFWTNTVERVIRTGAAVGLSAFVTDVVPGQDIDLRAGLVTTGLSMLATLLLCLAAKTTGDSESPSFVLAASPKINAPVAPNVPPLDDRPV